MLRALLFVGVLLVVAACGTDAPTPTPVVIVVTATPDAATATYTAIARPTSTPDAAALAQAARLATVSAENTRRAALGAAMLATQTALARPTNTPVPPSATPLPTDTPRPPSLSASSVKVTGLRMGYQDIDFANGINENRFTLALDYHNLLGLGLRTFRGVLTLSDPFGAPLKRTTVTITDRVAARGTGTWEGTMHYNQFIQNDIQLRQYVLSGTVIYDWALTQVIYEDGTIAVVP